MSFYARGLFVLLLAVFATPGTMFAQQTAASTGGSAAGPRIDASASAMRAGTAHDAASATQVRRSNSMGKPLSLIIVGGAAVVLGALIGNDIGTIFMLGGSVALLYGLYLYFR